MDAYILTYLYIVLIYGIYICVFSEDVQLSAEVNDDALKPKLRGTNNKNTTQRRLFTNDDFICDCDLVVAKMPSLSEHNIINEMLDKHYIMSGRRILVYEDETTCDCDTAKKSQELVLVITNPEITISDNINKTLEEPSRDSISRSHLRYAIASLFEIV
uniref:Uncharacterized protein n=1 Tax=viral metagenome TaxID=1070528 RepID=A0A6C0DQG9_9ZZZZ